MPPELVRDFLNYNLTIKGRSEGTAKEYLYDLTTFFKFIKMHKETAGQWQNIDDAENSKEFEKIDISDLDIEFIKTITLTDLYSFMAFLATQRKNKATSRSRKVACIRSFFNYLTTKRKLLTYNPAIELELPKTLKKLPKYLNIEESIGLLDSIDGEFSTRNYAVITLFLNCGIRLSELVNINITDIKEDSLVITGKGNKQRIVYLNNACEEALNDYMKIRNTAGVTDKDALFLSKRKKRISRKTIQYVIKKYLKQSGLDTKFYSTHTLRHTAATNMFVSGVDIRTIQEILGHESISTTEIYTHVNNQQVRDALSNGPLANYTKKENCDIIYRKSSNKKEK